MSLQMSETHDLGDLGLRVLGQRVAGLHGGSRCTLHDWQRPDVCTAAKCSRQLAIRTGRRASQQDMRKADGVIPDGG